ncbi:hypothetical protein [uncultured Aquimarina sp.]|uniref:hypothetical protein n=1 Tax=uncultured Aquimarina sp. TaxID=575652 RepID=UPI00260989A8|nr:hypothetical protein [uncultured Aquimarina sp.]
MKKTKMVFASMMLMLGLMATPYQSYALEDGEEEVCHDGDDCPYSEEPSVWDKIVAWWDAL